MPIYTSGHTVTLETLAESEVTIDNHDLIVDASELKLTPASGSCTYTMTSDSSSSASMLMTGGAAVATSNFSAKLDIDDSGSGDITIGVYSSGNPPSGWANGDAELSFGAFGFYADQSARSILVSDTGNGSLPDGSSLMEFSSTTAGVLFPRMTTTERNNISTPANGLVIYNTTDSKLQVRAGGAWVDLH